MKTALVTGGYGTIGSAIARHLAGRYEVLRPTSAELDVTSERSVTAYMAQFERLDLLVLAHGTYGEVGPVAHTYIDLWKQAFEVNLFGSYRVIQAALAFEVMREDGQIVVLTGGVAGTGKALPTISSYCASKEALLSLVRSLAQEEGAPRINAISPGRVASKMNRVLVDSGKAGRRVEAPIRALLEHGVGAVPVENTLAILDSLLERRCEATGNVYWARDYRDSRIAA